MIYAAGTHTGKVRENNEDFFQVDVSHGLLLVADGIGGHNAGEVASRLATETIITHVSEGYASKKSQIPGLITTAIEEANRVVYSHAVHNNSCFGMGTTITMAVLDGEVAYLGHIGDSRAYLFRKGKLQQLSVDHTLVNELLKNGSITEEDARLYPNRNIITKALGTDPEIVPDIYEIELENEDVILLCSDGLTDLIEIKDMEFILMHENALEQKVESLIELSLNAGGFDNITVVLYQHESKEVA